MSQKIGILGGTFNPVHFGHLAAAEEVLNRLNLDRVLFIPAFLPPHKSSHDVPDAAHRLEMVRLAIAGNPAFEARDTEIRRGGPSYTIDTIEELGKESPGAELHFIAGMDTFLEIQTWNDWKRLLTLCTFVVLSRPGYRFADLARLDFLRSFGRDFLDLDEGLTTQAVLIAGACRIVLEAIPLHDISSTDIRERLKAGLTVKYLLPDAVETYIIEHNLYA